MDVSFDHVPELSSLIHKPQLPMEEGLPKAKLMRVKNFEQNDYLTYVDKLLDAYAFSFPQSDF